MQTQSPISKQQQWRALGLSTFAFVGCFAVWTLFSIIGIEIKKELKLTDTEFSLLIATPILTGSLVRVLLGTLSDRFGGRRIFLILMLATSVAVELLSFATSYESMMMAALAVGIAGGSFAVGVAYVSQWYPQERQGMALGLFGIGNLGAALTSFGAPFLMIAYGWRNVAQIYALTLVIIAAIFMLFSKDDPVTQARRQGAAHPQSLAEQLAPLANGQVWRFSIYYFFVFGGFVALSLWLPRYYVGAYGLDLVTAGILTTLFTLPASLMRAVGGWLSDRIGARSVMYWSFGVSVACTFVLSYPATDFVVHGIAGPIPFTVSINEATFAFLTIVLGSAMALGMAAVYKHIPYYYPQHVGVVGGLVGLMGGLGGFVLPITFGLMNDLLGIWTACFALLFLIVVVNLSWMHAAILRMEGGIAVEPEKRQLLPGLEAAHALTVWRPEDAAFWESQGRRVAQRNLWISIPALLLAFAVWMVWSAVVVSLPAAGFAYTTDQLFWLAALPGLSGATLRLVYSFVVMIFGGRTWTVFSTALLLVPALGIGFAVQNPATPYSVMVALSLLCGLGGGNFASSMANISLFFPQRIKGHALALNAGLGNLGVSVVQFAVPLIITMGVFGSWGGPPQISGTGRMWLQNAGFLWVPFIVASTLAAWVGMNDIAEMRASLAQQFTVFKRKHTWILCGLYTGAFGSFIGFSAAFPLLTKTQFPHVNPMTYAFLGPLLGALARAGSGWLADRFGGARLAVASFAAMAFSVMGVIHALTGDGDAAFPLFLTMFLLLFVASGVCNAATYQMIPGVFSRAVAAQMAATGKGLDRRAIARETTPAIGVIAAVAAYGGFVIPKSYGTSIALTGSANAALYAFIAYYAACMAVTWWYYMRRGAEISLTAEAPTTERLGTASA
ncbi:MAG: MFS transporter [Rhodospirillaceae bacterium]|nr:MFS transporter [Rhodospirillaceae bacterium]